ncbi:MAG: LysR family transcriptional regulator [Gammaproteobacteria bacterium]|jgi:DNA-binding transcriptional LysR family regulator|nr:LysR family transcriptional regulator [Gammaproteobacteria bacterium]MDP6727993.1 LysR family transcriptional regulator [Gammaproteobacteria bacterium]MDP6974143.1 LysR family transcriptional regulator [Gammaproteobacteria bacterium]
MINYTLKQLYSFEAVIRLGSFTLASKELHITQPAVYMQVQQLQENIGSKIFNISGKKITPTFIGNKIRQTAVKAINIVESSKLEIEQSLNPNSGHLQIAVATTANSFVSNLLSKFKKEFPKMTFYIDVTNRDALLDNLRNKNADLVIMGEPPKNIALISSSFMENPLIAIAHPENELLSKKKISIKDLRKETLLTREIGSGTRITIERFTGLDFNSDIQINSNEAIVEAVQAGLGIGFVSKHSVKLQLENKVIKQLDVAPFPIIRQWHIVHHAEAELTPIAKRFKQFVIDNT